MEALTNVKKFARPNTRLSLIVISNGDNFVTEKISADKAAVRQALANTPQNTILLGVAGDLEGVESIKSYFNAGPVTQQIFNAKRQNDYQVNIIISFKKL